MNAPEVLIDGIRIAGGVQLAIVAANFFIPSVLRYREGLRGTPPIIRQIFIVHSVYIVFVQVIFAGICLFFAPELAGGSRLGAYLSGALASFWSLRIVLQLFYYDAEVRRQQRALDVAYTGALFYLTLVFLLAVTGWGR